MPNLSQIKRKRMLEFLEKIKEEHKNDDEMLIALGEIESELNAKKYGLVWEEHEEKVDVQMRTHIPVFTEVKEREIAAVPDKPYNFLLEGDNLHSLYLLEKTHKGKIDVIYIDPPYNTGNKDFVYDDSFVDSTDGFRHSKWLSFMEKRLQIARNLLSDRGVIFISIDDNEQAQIKMLCDSIFGFDNFICNFIRTNKTGSGHDARDISIEYDYMLFYAKDKKQVKLAQQIVDTENDKKYKYSDEFVETRGKYYLRDLDYKGSYSPSLDYPINVNGIDVYAGGKYGKPNTWRWSKQKVEWGFENGFIIIDERKQKIYIKQYQYVDNNNNVRERRLPYNAQIKFLNSAGSTELKDILTQSIFSFPKPTSLVEFAINLLEEKDINVLDFFAGSGTTAHAVINSNAIDGGNRKFILCTNNENGICEEVTYPRIKTVITGKRADDSTYSDGLPANLKYYRTDFVARAEEYLSDALLEHIAEMIQLEHGVKIDGSQYLMVMSDAEADELQKHFGEYSGVKALYVSKNVLLTTEQLKTFDGIEIHIIPDDYFKFELKEEGQAW